MQGPPIRYHPSKKWRVHFLLTLGFLAHAVVVVAASEVPHAPFRAKGIHVADGDTIRVLKGKESITIRVEGIDCPERGDPFSKKARNLTISMTKGFQLRIVPKEYDDYGRLIARVRRGNQDVSLALVRDGLAWHYKRYSDDPQLAAAEAHAQKMGYGVWSLPNPIPPWEYRRLRRQAESEKTRTGNGPGQDKRSKVPSGTTIYHGNENSQVFHAPWCRYYGCKNCGVSFKSKGAAVQKGYRACGICKP